jgi:uncharacterized protein DUF1592/uncharacterized protein DUF1588/uncharacterized protein DUF1595/uncharacterized protein DUF1587/uncharacterized protein DUF1585
MKTAPFVGAGLAAALALSLGCTGTIGNNESGSGATGGAPKVNDPGIIDQAGTAGNTGAGGGALAGSSGMASCTAGTPPVTTRLFRLTHAQYDNAVRVLTGLDVRPSVDFPIDQNQAGFDRGIDLQVGDALGKGYRAAAETLAASVAGNATAFSKVVGCDPAGGDACRDMFIANFGRRVFRRPLADAEKTPYATLFGMGSALVDGTADNFHKGVQVVVEAMLQSPNFIYRPELSTQASGSLIPLGGYELASRLSFFLVNGPPDDALLDAAANGQLGSADGVAAQAQRLIATDAARETVRDFHYQWLLMDSYANHLTKDSKYPTVTPDLAPVLAQETEKFVAEVTFAQAKGFKSLMTAPFTFVNATTAPLYGLTGSFGSSLQRVDLDPTKRAGLFTQLGFLATRAYSNQSSPIHRGAYVARHVLCTTIPDPPPNIPELPPLMATQTTRQQVDMHTAPVECASCHHTVINPVGFGFENYDAAGVYRTTENGVTIDATGTLASTAANTAFTDGVSESAAIAASPEAQRCYSTTWVRYAFGRAESAAEMCAIQVLGSRLQDDNYKVTDLMVDITRTTAFMFRGAN